MQDEKKAFARILCTVTATMASLCFVGVSIVLSIYYQTGNKGWRVAALLGIPAVFFFAVTSGFSLIQLYPKKGKFDERIWKLTLLFFVIGWAFFYFMMIALVLAV